VLSTTSASSGGEGDSWVGKKGDTQLNRVRRISCAGATMGRGGRNKKKKKKTYAGEGAGHRYIKRGQSIVGSGRVGWTCDDQDEAKKGKGL